jgi:hypothetical protein
MRLDPLRKTCVQPAPKSRLAVTGLFAFEDQRQIKGRSKAECVPSVGAGLLANAMGGLHLSKLTIRYCSAAYRSIIRALCMLMPPITLRALQFLLAECVPSVGAGLLANAVGGLHLGRLTIRYCSAAYRSIIRALCMLMRPITLRALQFLLAECIPSVGAGLLANAVGGLHLSRLTLQRSMASLQLDRSHASRPLVGRWFRSLSQRAL